MSLLPHLCQSNDEASHSAGHLFLVLSLTVVSCSLLSCVSSTTDWEKAQYHNTLSAYDQFIRKNPDSEFASEARSRIDRISFEQAKKDHTLTSLDTYLRQFPQGRFREEAAALRGQVATAMEEASYALAKKNNTIAGYEKFAKQYPESRHAEPVRRALDALYFSRAENEGTVNAYQSYLTKFPHGGYRDDAHRALQYLPLVEACLKRDKVAVRQMLESGRSLSGFEEAARYLIEILRMRLGKVVRMKSDFYGSNPFPMPAPNEIVGVSEQQKLHLFEQFTLLLEAGTNPNSKRLQGFKPASEAPVPGSQGVRLFSFGEPGRIVSGKESGLSALQLAQENDLTDYKALLLEYGARP